MILTRSIKLIYFFGFGILAFLLVVDADAKQADADHFDADNSNLNVFSVNVFGQGYYDVSFCSQTTLLCALQELNQAMPVLLPKIHLILRRVCLPFQV